MTTTPVTDVADAIYDFSEMLSDGYAYYSSNSEQTVLSIAEFLVSLITKTPIETASLAIAIGRRKENTAAEQWVWASRAVECARKAGFLLLPGTRAYPDFAAMDGRLEWLTIQNNLVYERDEQDILRPIIQE